MCDKDRVAVHTEDANKQHYEVPTEFFQMHLGKRLKYSASEWMTGEEDLDKAETGTLSIYQKENKMEDLKPGDFVLEMGCGWGSLSLKNARDYPDINFMSFSNSRTQIAYIQEQCKKENLTNLEVFVEDYNTFCTEDSVFHGEKFNRIFAIETLEHGRNIRKIFEWMSRRLTLMGGSVLSRALYTTIEDTFWTIRRGWVETSSPGGKCLLCKHIYILMNIFA